MGKRGAEKALETVGCTGSDIEVTDDLLNGEITADRNACGPNITAGVEVIFGVFDAEGTLPVNIPGFDQNEKKFTDSLVYERGYGITYFALEP